MGGLLSSKPAAAAPAAAQPPPPPMSSTDKAVLELKVSRDKLKRYKTKLEKERVQITAKAKTLVKEGKQPEALTLLKMKKYKDKQCSQLEGQLDNINQTLSSVITAEMTNRMMKALEQGTAALKRLNDEMPIEKIEALMDDTTEAIAYQQEVSSILAGSLTNEDVEDVDEELNAMLADINNGTKINLPEAPKGKLREQQPEVVPAAQKEERTLVAS